MWEERFALGCYYWENENKDIVILKKRNKWITKYNREDEKSFDTEKLARVYLKKEYGISEKEKSDS